MSFLWPNMLWLLLAVPLLVGLYLWLLRRRKRVALRYAALAMVREAMTASQGWRRHLPPLLFLLSLTAMLVAIARPTAVLTLPSRHETVILAMDVSGSMRATDVEPTRLAAAQAAARAFVGEQPRSARIGVVTFGASAALVQPPTHSREDVLASIDRFELQRGTAVGNGILVSLKTLFPDQAVRTAVAALASRPARRAARRAESRRGSRAAQAGRGGLVRFGRDHPAFGRADHHRPRSDRGGKARGRTRCAHLHGRHRHAEWRNRGRRGLVDARAARRGGAEVDRADHPRRLLLRRNRGRAEDRLPDA